MPDSSSLPPPAPASPAAPTDFASRNDLVADCRIMHKFALREGRLISDELMTEIGRLDSLLVARGFSPVSDVNPLFFRPAHFNGEPEFDTSLIMKVHGGLSRVVAPASALTLQVSEPSSEGSPWYRNFLGGMPGVVRLASVAAVVSAIGFVLTSIPSVQQAATSSGAAAAAQQSVTKQDAPAANAGAPAAAPAQTLGADNPAR